MRTELAQLCESLSIAAPALDPLVAFGELFVLWNRRLNLAGPSEPADLVEILFADALVLSRALPERARVLDVGAGGGAPALPLALLRPDASVTLMEPRGKRCAFLRTAITTVGLAGRATVIERRLEAGPVEGAPFDLALSRATFEPAEWLERARGLAARVAVLGVDALPDAGHGYRLLEEHPYRLPRSGRPRVLGIFEASSE